MQQIYVSLQKQIINKPVTNDQIFYSQRLIDVWKRK